MTAIVLLMTTENPSRSGRTPIAVDPAYRVRDNQFWYSDCTFAHLIQDTEEITLLVEGLGKCTLTHAQVGHDGRPTRSFTLTSASDRRWWKKNRGRKIRIELLSATGTTSGEPPVRSAPVSTDSGQADPRRPTTVEPTRTVPGSTLSIPKDSGSTVPGSPPRGAVLCIGLDIAWFGGSVGNRSSQFDCIGATLLGTSALPNLSLTRVRLGENNRDPNAGQTLNAIAALIEPHVSNGTRILFALDAPIQARPRPHLPRRAAALGKGEKGKIERRACEDWLSKQRSAIDRAAGGANGWHPTIQPGAPLAPRVEKLLAGLQQMGFALWTPTDRDAEKLVIECFPAEAIWSAKRQNGYPAGLSATSAKAYKMQTRNRLSRDQVKELVHVVLAGFERVSGDAHGWNALVGSATAWLLDDPVWQEDGLYRGGKLLDDVVDTMVCLATAVSYAHGCAHVWQDPERVGDGHIIGPGCPDAEPWVSAGNGRGPP